MFKLGSEISHRLKVPSSLLICSEMFLHLTGVHLGWAQPIDRTYLLRGRSSAWILSLLFRRFPWSPCNLSTSSAGPGLNRDITEKTGGRGPEGRWATETLITDREPHMREVSFPPNSMWTKEHEEIQIKTLTLKTPAALLLMNIKQDGELKSKWKIWIIW